MNERPVWIEIHSDEELESETELQQPILHVRKVAAYTSEAPTLTWNWKRFYGAICIILSLVHLAAAIFSRVVRNSSCDGCNNPILFLYFTEAHAFANGEIALSLLLGTCAVFQIYVLLFGMH